MLDHVNPTTAKAIEAINAISAAEQADWALNASQHGSSLPAEAHALADVLNEPTLQETINTYDAADLAATRARDWYKLLAGWSALLSLLAVLIAAVLLLSAAKIFDEQLNLRWIATIQGSFLVISFLLSLFAARLQPFDFWMSARAKAEWNRILFFKQVTEARREPNADAIPLLALQLEYFRRYQVDVQMKYYQERGALHARAARRASVIRFFATAFVIIASIPLVLSLTETNFEQWATTISLPDWIDDLDFQERLVIALSTTGAALQGWLAATALMNQDERNAARYAATVRNLKTLSGRPLDDARAAAAKGDAHDVQAFVELVQDQVSSEHREWIDLRTLTANGSLDAIKEAGLVR